MKVLSQITEWALNATVTPNKGKAERDLTDRRGGNKAME